MPGQTQPVQPNDTADQKSDFKPALSHDWLTKVYDPVMGITMRERAFRERLVTHICKTEPRQLVDVGCGTGSLALMLAKALPDATVVGVDPDSKILDIARRKADQAGVHVEFRQGMAGRLACEDSSQDAVVSSLMFHHLRPQDKVDALGEMKRVLRPSGKLHIADWGRGQDAAMRVAFLTVQLFDGFETTRLHASGGFPDLIESSGFTDLNSWCRFRTMFGTLELIEADPQ